MNLLVSKDLAFRGPSPTLKNFANEGCLTKTYSSGSSSIVVVIVVCCFGRVDSLFDMSVSCVLHCCYKW